jgi:hypothetical protein
MLLSVRGRQAVHGALRDVGRIGTRALDFPHSDQCTKCQHTTQRPGLIECYMIQLVQRRLLSYQRNLDQRVVWHSKMRSHSVKNCMTTEMLEINVTCPCAATYT